MENAVLPGLVLVVFQGFVEGFFFAEGPDRITPGVGLTEEAGAGAAVGRHHKPEPG